MSRRLRVVVVHAHHRRCHLVCRPRQGVCLNANFFMCLSPRLLLLFRPLNFLSTTQQTLSLSFSLSLLRVFPDLTNFSFCSFRLSTMSLRLGSCWASRSGARVSATSWAMCMTLSASGVENLMPWPMSRLVLSHWARLSSVTMLMVDTPAAVLSVQSVFVVLLQRIVTQKVHNVRVLRFAMRIYSHGSHIIPDSPPPPVSA